MLKQGGPRRLSACVGHSRGPSCLCCTDCAGTCNFFPHSAQVQPYVQVFVILLNQSLSPASTTLLSTVEPQHRTGRACVDSQHVPGRELWWSGCSQRSGLLVMCFLSKHKSWPLPFPPGLPKLCVVSVSFSCVLSPVLVAPDRIPHRDVK